MLLQINTPNNKSQALFRGFGELHKEKAAELCKKSRTAGAVLDGKVYRF